MHGRFSYCVRILYKNCFPRFHCNHHECKKPDDGSVYLSFDSNHMQETLFWLLRFGATVDVLNPSELKEMYAEEVKKMAKRVKS